jgi:hypothetical protein
LATVFGEVEVTRLAYSRRGQANLYPADAALNLPAERHSHGLRRLAAAEASRGSFEEAAALERATGQHLGKRQVEALTDRAALDVEAFYATRARQAGPSAEGAVLVVSADGKGIVTRPDALRPATAKAAAAATNKLECRLSKGQKRNRKRLAEVGAVYDLTPVARTPADVLATKSGDAPPAAPKAGAKWVTASVVEDAATVIAKVFDEAELSVVKSFGPTAPQMPAVVKLACHRNSLLTSGRRLERRAECLAQGGVHEVAADVGVDRGRGVTAMPDLFLDYLESAAGTGR